MATRASDDFRVRGNDHVGHAEVAEVGPDGGFPVPALAALRVIRDVAAVAEKEAQLAEIRDVLEEINRRTANARASYVNVICNAGAFGANMVKVGMTRRLEPMERVRELGDRSVPFRFDVHALFVADDAVGVETRLHGIFSSKSRGTCCTSPTAPRPSSGIRA